MALVDAADMAQKYPDTFKRPNETEIESLTAGDFVKVCGNDERFWLEVDQANYPHFVGTVSNHLLQGGVKFGDPIAFHASHVYDFQKQGAARFADN